MGARVVITILGDRVTRMVMRRRHGATGRANRWWNGDLTDRPSSDLPPGIRPAAGRDTGPRPGARTQRRAGGRKRVYARRRGGSLWPPSYFTVAAARPRLSSARPSSSSGRHPETPGRLCRPHYDRRKSLWDDRPALISRAADNAMTAGWGTFRSTRTPTARPAHTGHLTGLLDVTVGKELEEP